MQTATVVHCQLEWGDDSTNKKAAYSASSRSISSKQQRTEHITALIIHSLFFSNQRDIRGKQKQSHNTHKSIHAWSELIKKLMLLLSYTP